MKVKSTLIFNTSLLAQHSPSQIDGKVVIGGSQPKDVILPAGATLEIEDSLWVKYFEGPAQELISAGYLEITEEVVLSKSDADKAKKAKTAALKAQLAELEAS